MKNMQANQNGQMMQAGQMERQGSQMDNMSVQRSGSPGSGDAPSPKRQRLEGNMQAMTQGRPGQPGQIQGNQVGFSPSDPPPPYNAAEEKTREVLKKQELNPEELNPLLIRNLSGQATNVQAQAAEAYAASIKNQQTTQMNHNKITNSDINKGIPPNMGPGGAQGSPMSQPGMDVATGEFYAAANGGTRMAMQPNATAAAVAGQAGGSNGNHALQDYQMQLMLLEQQNKKRLLMARQEQDSMSGQHPGGVGPNGAFAQVMSPQGSQRGGDPSPNPNDMQRGTYLNLSARTENCPNANFGRGSPTPGMMDPNQIPPQMRAQMMAQNGQMVRPPSSHPMMSAQQVDMMRQQGLQLPNGQFPGGQPPQGMPGQPGQPGQPTGTPRQTNMPPPPAPQANAGGTQPSSPSQPPAPPTPSQTSKKAPTKKEAAKKVSANRESSSYVNNATDEFEGRCAEEGWRQCHTCHRIRSTPDAINSSRSDHPYERQLVQQEPKLTEWPGRTQRRASKQPAAKSTTATATGCPTYSTFTDCRHALWRPGRLGSVFRHATRVLESGQRRCAGKLRLRLFPQFGRRHGLWI